MNNLNSELSELIKEVPASFIPISPPAPQEESPIIDIDNINKDLWGKKSNQLLTDYTHGINLAKYGAFDVEDNKRILNKISIILCKIVTAEVQKNGLDTVDLKPYYEIIENTVNLLSKEIEKKGINFNNASIISMLHGAITNFTKGVK